MASNIQLKRSLNTSIPADLLDGEPAYTANGDVLYIGSNSEIVAIAGRRYPGQLTANQAIVTNSNNMIDVVRWGNTTVNAVINSTAFSLANSTVTFTIQKPTTVQQSGDYYLKADGNWSLASGGSAAPGGANTYIQFNDSGSLEGTAGFTFDKTSNNVLIGNALYVAIVGMGNSTVNSHANSLVHLIRDTSSTLTLNSTAVGVGSNVLVNTVRVHVGNSTVNASVNSVLVQVRDASGITNVTSNGIAVGSNYLNSSRFVGGVLDANSTAVAIGGDVTVSGNLTITGTTTTIDATNLIVQDPLIRLADDQANTGTYTDTFDIGFFGTYGNTSQSSSAGLFRDASDAGIFKLYSGQIPTPTTTVDTTNTNFAIATLQSYLKSGALISNSTTVSITANSTVSVSLVANTLSLSSALPGSSGGTGLSTYTAEDLLVANSTNGFRKLSIGGEGTILQVSSGQLVYDHLDGGVF